MLKRLTLMVFPLAISAWGGPFFFSTGTPDGKMATASRPGGPEIETADDFILNLQTILTGGSFTGLIVPSGLGVATINSVTIELYRVFPLDSTNPPSGAVPTRVNSPSDIAFFSQDSTAGLNFSTRQLAATFTASNSVLNGIHPIPNQTTGGDGAVTGQEFQFDFTLSGNPSFAAGHYFFIAQVDVTGGTFYWLSAPKPITGGSGPFSPDLQSWIRNAALDPNWLRIGTDIVGGTTPPTFNAAFSLNGFDVPEPSTFGLALLGVGALVLGARRRAQIAERNR